jgi:AraC-like DNA-binding protein
MGVTALDLGLRGAAAGLFLFMVVVVMVRARPLDAIKLLSAAMSAAGAAYAIVSAPFVPKAALFWTLPIMAANPVIFWLWARVTFDDDFTVRRRHAALWLTVIGIAFAVSFTWTTWPMLAKAGARSLAGIALVLSLAAAVQTVRTWSADLVAGRRRLRLAALILSLLFIALLEGSDLTSISSASVGISGSLATALGLFALSTVAAWSLFYPPPARPALVAIATDASGHAGAAPRIEPAADGGREAVAPLLLRRLDHLMTVERIHRQEGVTIGMLAARLGLTEQRLRQAINEGLGYRNFNAFLNRYRLDEAKVALSDLSQRDVPVLTIALDAGFQSIGPFNRAFKADTGLTPTEFRRDALTRPGSDAPGARRAGLAAGPAEISADPPVVSLCAAGTLCRDAAAAHRRRPARQQRPPARQHRSPDQPRDAQSAGSRAPGYSDRDRPQPRSDLDRVDGSADPRPFAGHQPAGRDRLWHGVRLRLAVAPPDRFAADPGAGLAAPPRARRLADHGEPCFCQLAATRPDAIRFAGATCYALAI